MCAIYANISLAKDRQAGTVPGMAREVVSPWRRVAASLRQRIEAAEWPPGGRLPTLGMLADEYQVSPTTVRKAIAVLRDAGLVESVRGWGTFVSEPNAN